VNRRRSFPIHSWVDQQHVSRHLGWVSFHFRDYRNYFCRPITSFFFTCGIFRIPDTFRPKWWSLASLRLQGSNFSPSDFIPLDLAPTTKVDLSLCPHPLSSLPSGLSCSKFKGVSEYLEDLLAWISVPILDSVQVTFFNQLVFSTSQLSRLIHHAKGLKNWKGALIVLCDHFIEITLFRKAYVDAHRINLRISCTGPDWQLESLTQVRNSILPPLSSLCIIDDLHHQPLWQDMENTQWLEFFTPICHCEEAVLI